MLKKLLTKLEHPTDTRSSGEGIDRDTKMSLSDHLADMFYHIATHNRKASCIIERYQSNDSDVQGLDVKIGFEVLRNLKRGVRCDCWFELEYCDFIHEQTVDKVMLGRICENIRRGNCAHISEDTKDSEREQSYIELIHVAAGADNKDIVKLLVQQHEEVQFSQTACGLRPFHLALVKSSRSVINFLLAIPRHFDMISGVLGCCDVKLAKRENETGRIIGHQPYEGCSNLINFVEMADNVSDETIRTVLPRHVGIFTINILLKRLLSSSKERMAYHIMQAYKRMIHPDCWYLLVYSVLLDSKRCLRELLKSPFSLSAQLNKLDYNLLDIAHAFGSRNCFSTLKSFKRQKCNLFQQVSPYTFLFKFAAASRDMDPYFMAQMIDKLHSLGHDVNHQDDLLMTPLLYAIGLVKYDPVVIHKLLDVGADIEMKDINGRTPFYCALTRYNSPLGSKQLCGTKGLLKDLLGCNPNIEAMGPSYIFFIQNSLQYAAEKDLALNSHLQYLDGDYTIKFKASTSDEQDCDIEAESYEEKVVALSYVGLLYEFGFKMRSSSLKYVGGKQNVQVLSDYLARKESEPRSLQSACRLTIRQAYRGSRLKTFLKCLQLPQKINDYILRPYILRYVEVTTFDIRGGEHTVQVDM